MSGIGGLGVMAWAQGGRHEEGSEGRQEGRAGLLMEDDEIRMEPDASIRILPVVNGWIVTQDVYGSRECISYSATYVAETVDALAAVVRDWANKGKSGGT